MGILGTNAYDVSDHEVGVYTKASNFNHSCSPNAIFLTNPNTGELRIHALDNIPPGDEIFVSYISADRFHGKPRQVRQDALLAEYHFTCACSLCSLSEAESKMSETKTLEFEEMMKNFGRKAHEMQRFLI